VDDEAISLKGLEIAYFQKKWGTFKIRPDFVYGDCKFYYIIAAALYI